jgi:pimeloyl-ACP methyl ester carboxylesterase
MNKHNFNLQCSHFEPLDQDGVAKNNIPCVIYLHGNCSSRLEAVDLVDFLLPKNMSLFCFDFAGCGQSEGEYISLGYHESEDLRVIMYHLRKYRGASAIALWGRSMGAVTALLYADKDPSIAALVLDSPFSSM